MRVTELTENPAKVKDIAVDIVNAILKSKDVTTIKDAHKQSKSVSSCSPH